MIFSIVGVLITAIILLPELLLVLLPPRHKPDIPGKPKDVCTLCENTGRVLCIVTPALSGLRFVAANINFWFWLMAASIALYYCLWIRYVFGDMRFVLLYKPCLGLPAPMGVFACASFLFLGMWSGARTITVSALLYALGRLENDRNLYLQCQKAEKEQAQAENAASAQP